MKRVRLILAGALAVIVILAIAQNPDWKNSYSPSKGPESNLAQENNFLELDSSSVIQRTDSKPGVLQFVDRLTGVPLALHKIQFSGDDANGEDISQSAIEIEQGELEAYVGFWIYSLQTTNGVIEMNAALNPERDPSVPIPLPWTSKVVFSPIDHLGSHIPSGTAKIAFPDEENWAKVLNNLVPSTDVFLPNQSMAKKLSAYDHNFKDLVWVDLMEEDGSYQASQLPQSGKGLLKFRHPIFGTSTHWVDLTPGDISYLETRLSARPVFEGRVVDEEGKAVPKAIVIVGAHLDPEVGHSGLLPVDGSYGSATFGEKGNYTYLSKRGVQADNDGRFTIDAPRGLGFALEAHSPDKSAYGYREVQASLPGEQKELIELILVQSLDSGPKIKCIDPNGQEVSGLEISFVISRDPWARTLPWVTSDAQNNVRYPWLSDEPVKVVVRMKENLDWRKAKGVVFLEYSGNPESTIVINVDWKDTE